MLALQEKALAAAWEEAGDSLVVDDFLVAEEEEFAGAVAVAHAVAAAPHTDSVAEELSSEVLAARNRHPFRKPQHRREIVS